MDEKSIMVNLGDEKVKEISEAIGNKSCNKVLGLLADGDLTVTDISKELKMPINTVDYNVKKLVKAGLIEKASHFWSVKGKKMPTYKVSNRKIIISPRKSVAKIFAWTIGLTGLLALTIRQLFERVENSAVIMVDSVSDFATEKAFMGGDMMAEATMDASPILAERVVVESSGFWSFLSGVAAWEWFLVGAWFAIFLFFVTTLINSRRYRL